MKNNERGSLDRPVITLGCDSLTGKREEIKANRSFSNYLNTEAQTHLIISSTNSASLCHSIEDQLETIESNSQNPSFTRRAEFCKKIC